MVAAVFFFLLHGLASAADMSIIDYDNKHHMSVVPERTKAEVKAMYESWLVKHRKAYNALGEKERRFEIFKDNLRFVDEHNKVNRSYKVGLNRFADMTNLEYRSKFLGMKKDRSSRLLGGESGRYMYQVGDKLPASVDWRAEGAVAEVKDQGQCVEFELVDCDKSYDQRCNGGLMDDAFQFIINNGGIDTEADYPYRGNKGTCDANRKNAHVVSIDGYEDGLFTGRCGTDLDHGVLTVGYGTEDGKDYWIVKNSWGPNWGDAGYIRLERNVPAKTGKCGIAIEPSYPTKKGQNPPRPGPSPPSPPPPVNTVCDDYYTCPTGTTCCCAYAYGNFCFGWGCCPMESATCCDDHYSCCPHAYPVCDIDAGTCKPSKNSPMCVKAMKRTAATSSIRWFGGRGPRA
ncbi:hypothetical protein ACLB2K_016971 [Fragaria x ananassa]